MNGFMVRYVKNGNLRGCAMADCPVEDVYATAEERAWKIVNIFEVSDFVKVEKLFEQDREEFLASCKFGDVVGADCMGVSYDGGKSFMLFHVLKLKETHGHGTFMCVDEKNLVFKDENNRFVSWKKVYPMPYANGKNI